MGVLAKLKRLVKGKPRQDRLALHSQDAKSPGKPVVARLPTRYFTGSTKAVSAAETFGKRVQRPMQAGTGHLIQNTPASTATRTHARTPLPPPPPLRSQ